MEERAPGGFPRIVIAGLSGDSGKTLVSLGLAALAKERGLPVAAFKKGPDFVDSAWLSWACGSPARNLDTFLMGFPVARDSFLRHGLPAGLNLVEGNRGLYDGADASGTHSAAELAKALEAPVVLVLNAAKMTRTAAALVLGCQRLDPAVNLVGVILNRVAGGRHERVLRESIEKACGVPVLGAVPRLSGDTPLPERHLGLFTPQEHPRLEGLREALARLCERNLNVAEILAAASAAPPLEAARERAAGCPARDVTVGYLWDSAFTFYYPENLEELERHGAEMVPLSPLSRDPFPEDLDALYIGGGFPETHGEALYRNRAWMDALRAAAEEGLPIYAECGGLMLLSRAILWGGRRFEMAGVLPFEVEVMGTPQGHGYTELLVEGENPFFEAGTRLRGHEFHYSRIVEPPADIGTACRVERGTGALRGRDGIVAKNVWASYTHLHALASPEWAPALIGAARRRRREKKR